MSATDLPLLIPDWPAPSSVLACSTTRRGGVSQGIFAALNLGDHVGDVDASVRQNRALLTQGLGIEARWLDQVHGIDVVDVARVVDGVAADAAVCREAGLACVVMTADCLPVLFCDQAGTVVAAAHAGWRGLAAGVLENTLAAMQVDPEQVLAWMGPAIGPQAFEVGNEVREVFVSQHSEHAVAFVPQGQKWLCDLYLLARQRLALQGLGRIYGGGHCTFSEPAQFFSYRRDGQTGRMAAAIALR